MATSDSNPKSITIQLTKGFVALVDEQDADLADLKWYASNRISEIAYAARQVYIGNRKNKSLSMHRVVLERMLGRPLQKGETCDHINHDPRDNRRSNLRLATVAENGANRQTKRNTNSGFKGVCAATDGNWQAKTRVNGKDIYLGVYKTPEEAYAAYCIEARKQFGEFAYLPDEDKVKHITPVRLTKSKK